MNQNKLLYNIVKIATNEAAYNYEDLPVAVQMEMARQYGESYAQDIHQNNLRARRLAQYVREQK